MEGKQEHHDMETLVVAQQKQLLQEGSPETEQDSEKEEEARRFGHVERWIWRLQHHWHSRAERSAFET